MSLPLHLIAELEHTLVEYVAQCFADRDYSGVPAPDLGAIAAAAQTLLTRATQRVIIGNTPTKKSRL